MVGLIGVWPDTYNSTETWSAHSHCGCKYQDVHSAVMMWMINTATTDICNVQ